MKMDRAITRNLVEMVRDMSNVDEVVIGLHASGVLGRYQKERLAAEKTPTGKSSLMCDYLCRRPDGEFEVLLDVLDGTGNGHLADLLRPGREKKKKVVVVNRLFDELLSSLRAMAPIATVTERSNVPVYKVSVNVYSGAVPRSEVGLNDLAYVVALYVGKSRASVQSWPGCPSGPVLDRVWEEYESEMRSTEELMESLVECDVELRSECCVAMHRAMRVLGVDIIALWWRRGEQSAWGEPKRRWTTAMVHLWTFGRKVSLTVRRDFAPKPSSYLMLNANMQSFVILPFDRQIVMPVLGSDESNTTTTTVEEVLEACPF